MKYSNFELKMTPEIQQDSFFILWVYSNYRNVEKVDR